jgi:hypothetical protein
VSCTCALNRASPGLNCGARSDRVSILNFLAPRTSFCVNTEGVRPIFLKVALEEVVAPVELESKEGSHSVQDLSLLTGSGRAVGQSSVEVGVSDDKGARVVVAV